jgi:predicted ATPase/DNA-binding XRE family transcriptional regulator
MADQETFGQWLRRRRRAMDLTQLDLGKAVGCAQITIRKIEAGYLRPSRQLSEMLVKALGVPDNQSQNYIQFARTGLPPISNTPTQIENSLPQWLNSFIGRETEIKEISDILRSSRLVTLSGAGGSGKTRLAVRVAEGILNQYQDGTWFVDLAAIAKPELVPQTGATVLGLQRSGETNFQSVLTNFLHDRQMLLILDNCEHILDACAQLTDILLRNCPKVTILTTSREVLGIEGERIYRVLSLETYDPATEADLQTLARSESIRLFVERAAAIMPGFEPSDDILPSIARICYHLDGIPLAVELAAARMSFLSVGEIAERLDDRFRLLNGGGRMLPRQRTMRASIDWSYSLLTVDERIIFQRLSIFLGGWSLEAAEMVCSGEGLERDAVMELLDSLVKKSLVRVGLSAGEKARYSMLETIRQYGIEKLAESGQSVNTRNRHFDFYYALANVKGPLLKTSRVVEILVSITPDLDNLRSALEWAKEQSSLDYAEKALGILCSLDYFWAIRGLYWEMFPHFLHFLEIIPDDTEQNLRLRARGLYTLATLQTDFNIEMEIIGHLTECVAGFRQVHDPGGLALALSLRSYLIFRHYHFFPPVPAFTREEAQRDQEESTEIASRLSQVPGEQNDRVVAWVNCWNGAGEVFRPDPEKAKALGMLSMKIMQSLGDTLGEQYGLLEWLMACLSLGDYSKLPSYIDHAIELAQGIDHKRYLAFFIHQKIVTLYYHQNFDGMESLALQGYTLHRQLGSPLGDVENHTFLGIACIKMGDYAKASAYLCAGLQTSSQIMSYKDPFNILNILIVFSGLAAETQHYERASTLIGFVDYQLASYSKELDDMMKTEFDTYKERTQGGLSDIDYQYSWQRGADMGMEQAVEFALEEQV